MVNQKNKCTLLHMSNSMAKGNQNKTEKNITKTTTAQYESL